MKFGMMFANTGPFATLEGLTELAQAAETGGFESIWTVEHVIWPASYDSAYPYHPSGKMAGESGTPLPDPLIWLSFVAARTTTIRLATGILILPERNPVVLAKELGTLDALSGGRFELGIGVGWLREEFDALGVPWERRGARTDEYVAAMQTLWSGDEVSFDGEFVSFENVSTNPKPVQAELPITVGGHSTAAARRAGRLGHGFFPGTGTPEQLAELFDIVHQTAADAGRDPEAITLMAAHPGLFGDDPVGAAQELASVGVTRSIVPAFLCTRPTIAEGVEAMAAKIVGPCADV